MPASSSCNKICSCQGKQSLWFTGSKYRSEETCDLHDSISFLSGHQFRVVRENFSTDLHDKYMEIDINALTWASDSRRKRIEWLQNEGWKRNIKGSHTTDCTHCLAAWIVSQREVNGVSESSEWRAEMTQYSSWGGGCSLWRESRGKMYIQSRTRRLTKGKYEHEDPDDEGREKRRLFRSSS